MPDSTGNGSSPHLPAGTAESIFTQAQPRAFRDVDVPEWGVRVRVQELSTADRERFENAVAEESPAGHETPSLRALFVSMAVVSEATGQPIFTKEQVPALAKLPAGPLVRLFAIGRTVSKMLPEDTEELSKELKKLRSGATSSA